MRYENPLHLAEEAAKDGLNLMSSILVSETTAETLGKIQADQISRYRAAWKEAGHDWTPRVSVSRSIFLIVDGADMQLFGMQASGSDQVGTLPGVGASTFGRTYAAVMSANTLLITISAGIGMDVNVKILDNFATHLAPALGWQPNHKSPVTVFPID
ncbi:flavin-dependent oxidoreductase [Gulosibacter hominis]|uniref:flavin-dependent oxidoreductase n=1 Tax=Gulosibacter hominis TaxID=2770504 RepID=UPI001E552E3B|nr:flavin-dependent oxidoreductase [Gulosibacter hominis]